MADTIELEFDTNDPGSPGQMNLKITTPRDHERYVDNRVNAVGYGIYVGGFLLYCNGLDRPVLVPESLVDFSPGPYTAADGAIYPSRGEAESAIPTGVALPGQGPPFAYYWGAGGALVVPTRFARGTAPRTVETMSSAIDKLVAEVTGELMVIALGLAGGLILTPICRGIAKLGEKVLLKGKILTPSTIPPKLPLPAPKVPRPMSGERPSIQYGGFGAPDCLWGHIEASPGNVKYVVKGISATGPEASAVTAAHREMLVTSARLAKANGLNEFTLHGDQAGPNFRTHADKLANAVGVPNSGKALPGIGNGHYEVTLKADAVLRTNP